MTLVGYGLWAIGGITRFDVPGNPDYYVTRQAIAVAVGVVGMLVAILIPPSLYQRHWRFLYGGTIGVMLFVFVFAEAVRGSKRWIDLGPFQFQPSEFGKLFFVLAIAGFLVERGRRVGEIGTVADRDRARARADRPRLPPARPRHRARLRRRPHRRALPLRRALAPPDPARRHGARAV